MNLEDYAYLDDGRWYVNPNVSLREQSEFISNLRNLQAQDNAQIEQQTRGLGTQVPSQLGGLTGAGSYFRSRYQTPQTNLTVAELRSKMQNEALERVISNELAKGKKKYQDAYRAAQERSSNSNNNSNDPIYNQVIDGLKINTNTGEDNSPSGGDINDDVVRDGEFGIDSDSGYTFYQKDGHRYVVLPTTESDWGKFGDITGTAEKGTIVTGTDGRKYIYTGRKWYVLGGDMDTMSLWPLFTDSEGSDEND